MESREKAGGSKAGQSRAKRRKESSPSSLASSLLLLQDRFCMHEKEDKEVQLGGKREKRVRESLPSSLFSCVWRWRLGLPPSPLPPLHDHPPLYYARIVLQTRPPTPALALSPSLLDSSTTGLGRGLHRASAVALSQTTSLPSPPRAFLLLVSRRFSLLFADRDRLHACQSKARVL